MREEFRKDWMLRNREIKNKVAWDYYYEREHFKPGTVKLMRSKNSFSPEQMKELEKKGQLNLLDELEELS